MQFIDHTGHIFSMPSYSRKPIGYEYEETEYVFWLNSEYSYKLSVDTYHLKPIRFIAEGTVESISISVDSKKFALIGSTEIQDQLERGSEIQLFEDEHIKSSLSKDDLTEVSELKIDDEGSYSLYTFYVACCSDEAGTWETNILINADNEWCPITVGAEIVDECEELIVNGTNVGISLPKDIIRAVYQSNVFEAYADERLYAQKMKELLMNFMNIKGEEGNYRSALNALKWFGWGDKLTVYKLLHTDNEVVDQYIRDRFDISNDVIDSFKNFRNDALIAIDLPIDYEEGEEPFVFTNEFWGENKPTVHSYFDKDIIVHYDEGDIDFHRNYFDHTFEELGLKLCLLKYYYEKYFLPIHMHVSSLSMSRKVYANDIKFVSNGYPKITADPVFIKDMSIDVKFPDVDTFYFHYAEVLMDEQFNSFTFTEWQKQSETETIYALSETVAEIPIEFISKVDNQYFNATLSLYKDNVLVHSGSFQFVQTEEFKYDKFIIFPKALNKIGEDDITNWLSSNYRIELNVNSNVYSYEFKLKMPEMNLCMGVLKYKYDKRFRQLDNKKDFPNFQAYMHDHRFVTVSNINVLDELEQFSDNLEEYVEKHYKSSTNIMNKKYFNRCHLYKIKDLDGNEIKSCGEEANNVLELNIEEHNLELLYNERMYTAFRNLRVDDYDAFLMIEGTNKSYNKIEYGCWYLVLISRHTEDYYEDLEAPTNIVVSGYTFEYERSDDKFLVNRYKLEESNGINHFKNEDLIAFYLRSNERLPYNVLENKWEIKPLSIGMTSIAKVENKNEMAIIGVGDTNFRYEKGYYTVTCRYSLDGHKNKEMTKTAKFRID